MTDTLLAFLVERLRGHSVTLLRDVSPADAEQPTLVRLDGFSVGKGRSVALDDLRAAANTWTPFDAATAPRDKPILALCSHAADPYDHPTIPDRLTTYAAHAEQISHVRDGAHVVVFGGAIDDQDGSIPAWWFLDDGTFETVANPIAYRLLPDVEWSPYVEP